MMVILGSKNFSIYITVLKSVHATSSHHFKSSLKLYYSNALTKIYDCNDLRTWKTVCVKCKRAALVAR